MYGIIYYCWIGEILAMILQKLVPTYMKDTRHNIKLLQSVTLNYDGAVSLYYVCDFTLFTTTTSHISILFNLVS